MRGPEPGAVRAVTLIMFITRTFFPGYHVEQFISRTGQKKSGGEIYGSPRLLDVEPGRGDLDGNDVAGFVWVPGRHALSEGLTPADCKSGIFVRQLLWVYPQITMGIKLLTAVLVLLLSGANSGAALICAASCMSSAPLAGAAVHHHEMESQQSTTQARQHSHHHGAPCAECPPTVGSSLNEKSTCTRLSETQALREGSFSLKSPTGVAPSQVNRPADGLALGSDCQQSFLFADSPTSRSAGPPLLPLRI
jgi:hypothetical protein